jgi:chromosome partitioning protein
MRSILILNAKGGCGKTTIATNLAGYYAERGKSVVLADFDPQGSSTDWLAARPGDRAEIKGVVAWEDSFRLPKTVDYLVMDSPAGVDDKALTGLVRRAESIILPVLPSIIDIRAAQRFLHGLLELKRVVNKEVKLATVANRVRDHTLAAAELQDYLRSLRLPDGQHFPVLTVLRSSQNYIHAAERGLSIFEFSRSQTLVDREQWTPLLRWLNSARSRPKP